MLAAILTLLVTADRTWGPPQRLFEIADPRVKESSGLAASRRQAGVFYTHNDSGDSARFFRFDRSGEVTGVFTLRMATARDWEDMAAARVDGNDYLYLADIGDNPRARETIVIHRVSEPEGEGRTLRDFQTYTLTYPDRAQDAEALLVDPGSGDLYVVTKAASGAGVYRLAAPRRSDRFTLQRLGEVRIDTGGIGGRLVTAGDVSPDGRFVVLRTYSGALEFPVGARFRDWFRAAPKPIKLAPEVQGEAVCYTRDGRGLLTSGEGSPCPVSLIPLVP